MLSGFWRCRSDLVLDVLGVLVQPMGLALLLGIWGVLATFNHRWEPRVRLLLRELAIQAILLWTLLLVAALLANNPTRIINGGEYLGIIASWLTVFRHLRQGVKAMRSERMPGPAERAVSHPYRASPNAKVPTPTVAARWRSALRGVSLALWSALVLTAIGLVALVVGAVVSPTAVPSSGALCLLPAAGAWTLAVLLHRKTNAGSAGSGPSKRRPRLRRVLGVTAVLIVGVYLGPPLAVSFSAPDSPWRLPGRLAAWVFALKTAPLATDECLVSRIARYAEAGPAGTFGGDIARGVTARASDAAHEELRERGKSALPAIEHGLLSAIESEDVEQQENLVELLRRATRWPEADEIIRRWAHATPAPAAQPLVRKWLVCIEKGRRKFIIGKVTDRHCDPIESRAAEPL